MTAADLKSQTRRIYDDLVGGDNVDELIDELMSDDFVEHEAFPGMTADREGQRQFFHMMRQAFPDMSAEIRELIAEGSKVVARVRFTGTHRGEFAGIPSTGKAVDFDVIDVFAWRDGQATDHWGVSDTLTLMTQIGALENGG